MDLEARTERGGMMGSDYLVIGHFRHIDATLEAIGRMQEEGRGEALELYSGFPNHDLEEALYRGRRRSPVRMFTLLGGVCGCLGGFLMTSWMSIDWPLRVSAKPLLSYPAFTVVAFECTILLGAICTLASMFHFSRIPNYFFRPGFRPQFTNDIFGLTVRVPSGEKERIKELFDGLGAEKVEFQYVR